MYIIEMISISVRLRLVSEPRMRDGAPLIPGHQLVLAAVAHRRGVVVPDRDEPDAFFFKQ